MNIFQKIKRNKIGSSTFNLSCDRKFSMNMGDLVPCHVQEIVPGDKITMNTQQMLRFMPLIAPVMHEVNVFVHYYFVPNRILWKGWEDFITGGENGLDATIPPYIGGVLGTADNYFINPGDLGDYLGLPLNLTGSSAHYPDVSILPHLAYQKIYNDYYRDQNMTQEIDLSVVVEGKNSAQTPSIIPLLQLRKRAWMHDYFTSALPWAQKGEPVNLPLGDRADLVYKEEGDPGLIKPTQVKRYPDDELILNAGELNTDAFGNLSADSTTDVKLDVTGSHYVDLSGATATTIGDLRTAIQLQAWLERNARGGSRYIETIASHFDVQSSDKRMQRPEFLGGSMSPVMVSEVLQTSQTQDTPLAEMAGHALNLGKSQGFSRTFEEHGYLMAICSVMPKTAYMQGIPRQFTKFDKFDYYWPAFQHIGEQEIKNKELLALVANDSEYDVEQTFGYIPRYSEYKYNPNTVHGDFRLSLDFWHLGRKFDVNDPPYLNEDFIIANPSDRIFAVEDSPEQKLLVHMFHNIQAKRKMSYFGDPSIRL